MPDLVGSAGPVACVVVLGLLIVESGLLVGVLLPGDSLLFGAGLLVGSGAVEVPLAVRLGPHHPQEEAQTRRAGFLAIFSTVPATGATMSDRL